MYFRKADGFELRVNIIMDLSSLLFFCNRMIFNERFLLDRSLVYYSILGQMAEQA